MRFNSINIFVILSYIFLSDPKSVPGDVSDSPADSNPDRDSALESDGSDNSNSDTSEENWETVPAQEYGDRAYARYIVVVVVVVVVVYSYSL